MFNLIDFSQCKENPKKSFLGASSPKKCLIYNGKQYMVKFPAVPNSARTTLSYANGCLSEYLGCHIFEIAQIPVQKTLLGTYRTETGKNKLVVACGDLEKPGTILMPFAGLKNQMINSPTNGFSTDLKELEEVFEKQALFDKETISAFFWDMFIVDALIGNFDRHNGNWCYLYNSLEDSVSLAPVYDCASSLFPQADEKTIDSILNNKAEMEKRIFVFPNSAIKLDGKKLSYYEYINSFVNKDCTNALLRVYPRLDIDKIYALFNFLEGIVDAKQIAFYKTMIKERKERILEPAYEKARQIQKQKTKKKKTSLADDR